MGKEQCSSYCIFRSSREGYWRSLKKYIYIFCARQKLEWLLPISSTRSRPSLEVATCRGRDRKWCRDLVCFCWEETASRHGFDVATWAAVGEVVTWNFGVATWKSHCGQKRGRDMKLMSRHRFVSRKVATWS